MAAFNFVRYTRCLVPGIASACCIHNVSHTKSKLYCMQNDVEVLEKKTEKKYPGLNVDLYRKLHAHCNLNVLHCKLLFCMLLLIVLHSFSNFKLLLLQRFETINHRKDSIVILTNCRSN